MSPISTYEDAVKAITEAKEKPELHLETLNGLEAFFRARIDKQAQKELEPKAPSDPDGDRERDVAQAYRSTRPHFAASTTASTARSNALKSPLSDV